MHPMTTDDVIEHESPAGIIVWWDRSVFIPTCFPFIGTFISKIFDHFSHLSAPLIVHEYGQHDSQSEAETVEVTNHGPSIHPSIQQGLLEPNVGRIRTVWDGYLASHLYTGSKWRRVIHLDSCGRPEHVTWASVASASACGSQSESDLIISVPMFHNESYRLLYLLGLLHLTFCLLLLHSDFLYKAEMI